MACCEEPVFPVHRAVPGRSICHLVWMHVCVSCGLFDHIFSTPVRPEPVLLAGTLTEFEVIICVAVCPWLLAISRLMYQRARRFLSPVFTASLDKNKAKVLCNDSVLLIYDLNIPCTVL